MYAYFSDSSAHLVDIKPLIERGGMFARLSDEVFFRETLPVMHGTVAWGITDTRDETQCIDLDPCTTYECPVIKDPLESVA